MVNSGVPLTLCTTNEGKWREWNQILQDFGSAKYLAVERMSNKLDLIELQGPDAHTVVVAKALDAWFQNHKVPVLVEDVTFSCLGIGRFPDFLYAPVEKMIGVEGILRVLHGQADRTAVVTMTIAFATSDGNLVHLASAAMQGAVPMEPRGENGFGFDSIFIPNGQTLTFAEMTSEQKNQCSMRRKAIEVLVNGEWRTVSSNLSPMCRYTQGR